MVTAHHTDQHSAHFRTDHLMADLKGRSVRGGAVTMAAQGAKFVLQLGSTAILARLLTPADFGLVAMVTAVTGFVALFKDAGLSMATVQREHVTHDQVSTLFWINVALSAALMLVTAALAPAIAWFYGEPRLTAITLAFAATFILGGFTVQHQALLQRQMRFKAIAAVDLLGLIVGIVTAVAMAWRGFGYWALVGMTASAACINCVIVWGLSRWRPGLPRRGCGVRDMLRFGGGLTSFNFLNYFTRNADNVIIGHSLGGEALGIYSKAYNLLMMPIRQISGPMGTVMVPSLSRLRVDPPRYRRAYLRAIHTLAFVGMPLVAFLFVGAPEVVAILLGPGWGNAADVFRWLAPAAFLGTVNVAPGWLCISLGRAREQVIWAVISMPVTIAAFLVGLHWGVVGVAAAFSLSWSSMFVLFVVMACHRSPVGLAELLICLSGPILSSLAATVASFTVYGWIVKIEDFMFVSLLIRLALFVLVYSIVSLLWPVGRFRLVDLWNDAVAASIGMRGKGNAS